MVENAPRGEAGILARLLEHVGTGRQVEVGPGDDAAVVALPSSRLVITTDTLVEGYDFLPGTTTPRWVGHKAAVQNLADVAAMGARPVALVAAVSAPADTPVAWFEEVTAGLTARAARDGAVLVGGDLGRSDRCTLTVTAVGALEEGQEPVLRSGARPGDDLAIGAERLGRSAAGLAVVLSGRARVEQDRGRSRGQATPEADIVLEDGLDPSARDVLRWHDAPDPDLALGWTDGGEATAMMDLSDGLVRDGGRIADASGVRLDLDAEALRPDIDHLALLAAQLGADPWDWVLHGGEEHAMLATFPPGRVPPGFRRIGRVRDPGGQLEPRVLLAGRGITGEGFDHFA